MAMGLGLVFWMFLLFSPLAWVGQANASTDDFENYGTVIGIVSFPYSWQLPVVASWDALHLILRSLERQSNLSRMLTGLPTGSGNNVLLCGCDDRRQG